MAGGRRGLVAPQNTFLENIVRRSSGKRCIRISVTQAFYPCLDCRRLPPLGASRCSRTRSSAGSPGAGVRSCLPEARLGGQGGARSVGPPSQEESSAGDAFGGPTRAFSVSSPASVTADGQSTGKSDGKPDAARAAARSPWVLPTPPRRLAGLSGCTPGAASPQGEPAVEEATRVRAPEG